jgi:hypothetical protein
MKDIKEKPEYVRELYAQSMVEYLKNYYEKDIR